ncbi:uncharacterized protein isoform X2 [Rhodnius prolixus]
MRKNRIVCNGAIPTLAQNGDIYNGTRDNGIASHRYESCQNLSENESHMAAYKQADLNSIEQLKVLYDVRMREMERLKSELDAERSSKKQILRKLTICETEKSGILSNNKQINESLTLSREKISELENEISRLLEENKKVEKERNEWKNESEILKLQILNLEQQMKVMQRCDGLVARDKQFENTIETLKIKHRKEINSLEQQYESALQKIREKEDAQKLLEQKIEEMESRHVATLLNKCDATVRQEATVKALLDQANMEKLELTKKMNALQAECNMLRNDLEQYESVSRLRLFSTSSSDELDNDSMTQFGLSKRNENKKSNSSTSNVHKTHNHYTEDIISKLKAELHRAIIGQRSKRHEIKKLQEQIQNKELQINKLREQEKSYIYQLDNFKKEVVNLKDLLKESMENATDSKQSEKIDQLESELEKLKTEKEANLNKIISLENEVKSLQEQLKKEELNKQRQGEEYVQFHDHEMAKLNNHHQVLLKEKELEWSKKMEEILNENDEVKQLYIELRESKDKLLKKIEEESLITNKYIKEKDELKIQTDELKTDVKRLENHILELNEDKRDLECKLKKIQNELQYNHVSEDKIQTDIIIAPNGSKISLHQMREEVALAKQKYVELEKTLKLEFEERILKLQLDNSQLREALKEKEENISKLRKVNCTKVDTATFTGDNILPEVSLINENQIEEINKLEKEIERLKALELNKSQEILKLEFEYQKKLQVELEELETKLIAKHKEEMSSAEERIKNVSVQYYTSEMSKLQELHKNEIESLKQQYSLKNEEIKRALINKESEVQQTIEIKKQFDYLKERLEIEKDVSNEKLAKLTRELEELKIKHEECEKEIDELKAKLIYARKKVLTYKVALQKMKNKIPENYATLMAEIKDRSEAIAYKETVVEKKLRAIEKELEVLRK